MYFSWFWTEMADIFEILNSEIEERDTNLAFMNLKKVKILLTSL